MQEIVELLLAGITLSSFIFLCVAHMVAVRILVHFFYTKASVN